MAVSARFAISGPAAAITMNNCLGMTENLKQESKQPKAWWHMSFADAAAGPLGGECLGINVLFDHGVLHCIQQSRRRGINPGGPADRVPPPEFHDRLLSDTDVRNMWDDYVSVRSHEILARHKKGTNQ
jgi:hypothetical protein